MSIIVNLLSHKTPKVIPHGAPLYPRITSFLCSLPLCWPLWPLLCSALKRSPDFSLSPVLLKTVLQALPSCYLKKKKISG